MINEKNVDLRLQELLQHNFSYILMKLFGRFGFIRKFVLIKNRISKRRVETKIMDEYISFENSIGDIVQSLENFGYADKLRLAKKALLEIENYAHQYPCYANKNKKLGFYVKDLSGFEKNQNKKVLIAHYCNLVNNSSEIKKISESRVLQEIAQGYLGDGAKRIDTQMWWTFPGTFNEIERAKYAHFYHRDLDDWSFIKFFFYITKVESGDGGHYFVKKSHKPNLYQSIKERLRIKREFDVTIENWYGKDSVLEVIGDAGDGVVENTFGFHKGQTPSKDPRLIFCVVYAVNDYLAQEFNAPAEDLFTYSTN